MAVIIEKRENIIKQIAFVLGEVVNYLNTPSKTDNKSITQIVYLLRRSADLLEQVNNKESMKFNAEFFRNLVPSAKSKSK